MVLRSVSAAVAASVIAVGSLGTPVAGARGEGDTHVYGSGLSQMLDCNNSTLFVNGSFNIINVSGTCYAVTMQGTGNTVIAETVLNDITVYGFDQTVYFKFGEPYIEDRGRGPGTRSTNRIDRVPA